IASAPSMRIPCYAVAPEPLRASAVSDRGSVPVPKPTFFGASGKRRAALQCARWPRILLSGYRYWNSTGFHRFRARRNQHPMPIRLTPKTTIGSVMPYDLAFGLSYDAAGNAADVPIGRRGGSVPAGCPVAD